MTVISNCLVTPTPTPHYIGRCLETLSTKMGKLEGQSPSVMLGLWSDINDYSLATTLSALNIL
jgi:hypothetical protein